MILHCKNCDKLLSVENSKLAKNNSMVKCPSCNSVTVVAPKIASCGKCQTDIKYFEYKLNPKNPLVKCPACEQVNKVKVNNTSFLVIANNN